MVLTSFSATYYATGPQTQGQRVHIITTTPQVAGAAGATASSPAPTSQDLWQKFYEGASGTKTSPERNLSEESRAHFLQIEKLHRETLLEKDDTIANLRDTILQHEKRLQELEDQTDENITARQHSGALGRARFSPTQKLLNQIERLQTEKENLLQKVSDLHIAKSKSGRAVDHGRRSDSESSSSEVGPCSTDTEKELDKMKREKFRQDKEFSRLRIENSRLRERLSQFGVDFSDILEGVFIVDQSSRLDDSFHAEDVRRYQLQTQISRRDSEEATHDGLGDSGYHEGPSVSSLDRQVTALQHELDQKTLALQLAQSQNNTDDTDRLNDIIARFRQMVPKVFTEFQELKRSYLALKEEMKSAQSSFDDLVLQLQKQVKKSLSETDEKYQHVVEKYLREMKLRKKHHNELVELRGNIRVFCRIRPWIKEDGNEEDDIVVTCDPDDDAMININNKGRNQWFDMDKVFGMQSSQAQVFEEVSPLVRSVIDGFNVCIFAYGQTGSGKTYTMEGPRGDPGINQRALQLLFEETVDGDWQYGITASILEIYNEVIRDLLNPDPTNKLEVRMKQEGGLHVPGLVQVPVSSLEEVNQIFETGSRNRATACTNMNEHSSRSHCMLCINVIGHNPTTGSKTFGRLNLVDLAGSERVSKSHADGLQLKEAQSINKSLACLGDVIHALRNKHGHVPYRNSKLTYLLQDSLGGDSKTLMIVQVAPVEKNVSESVCTLTFGQRVRNVELGAATKNVENGKSTQTKKRPSSLLITPSSSTTSSPLASPSSTSSTPRGSPLPGALSSPLLNGKRIPSSPSSLSSLSTPPSTPTMLRSPLLQRSASSKGTASPTLRRKPPSPKSNDTHNLNKSATVPNNLSGTPKDK